MTDSHELPEELRDPQKVIERGTMLNRLLDQRNAAWKELDRLNALIESAASHWLSLGLEFPIAWEGGIDAAMEAACNEIRRLKAHPIPQQRTEPPL